MTVKVVFHSSGENWDMPVRWTVAQCGSCASPALFGEEWLGQFEEREIWGDRWQAYPTADRGLSFDVPDDIRTDFAEAQTCLRAGAFRAAAIMARRALESICHDQGVTSGKLAQRLEKLKDNGTIDQRLNDWAEACREVGNEGAHERGAGVSREDATDVLGFVEALADYLYVYRARYDKFKSRRTPTAP